MGFKIHTIKASRKALLPKFSVSSKLILTGVPSTNDIIQLYHVSTNTITPLNYATVNENYKLITIYNGSDDVNSIAHYLQFHTPDWYGLWVNGYNATTNATGYPTTNWSIIGSLEYVIWPYAFTFSLNETKVFYLYGLTTSNTVPFNPLTQNARIELTFKAV
jgi:hypothetical protein